MPPMPATHRPRPTGSELFHQMRTFVMDLPLFVTAPLYRPWHLRWGATPTGVTSELPGDACCRAISDRRDHE